MKKKLHHYILIPLSFLLIAGRAYGQVSVSINYDEQTAETMAKRFAELIAAESLYAKNVEKIRNDYEAALKATSLIFSQKYLERKALTELSNWKNSQENYYYRRAHDMVQNHIIPAMWNIGRQMVKDPATALYWGPYMYTTIEDTKNLCYEFESIVSNSTLGFSDINFIEFNPQIAALFQLSKMGGQDWKTALQQFNISDGTFSKENMQAAVDNMKNIIKNLPNTAVNNVTQSVMDGAEFDGNLLAKIQSVATVAENINTLYNNLSNNGAQTLINILGIGDANVNKLFVRSNYNVEEWANDYVREIALSQYYTQHWYIETETKKIEMQSFTPNVADCPNSPWRRFSVRNGETIITDIDDETLRRAAERLYGWSQLKVDELNAADGIYTYKISYELKKASIPATAQRFFYAAYAIHVTKESKSSQIVYDAVFDSQTMDWATFQAELNSRLAVYNNNIQGKIYYVNSDEKRYYQTATESQMTSCEQAVFNVSCHNETQLASGDTKYPCSHVGKEGTLKPECRDCSMIDKEIFTTQEAEINAQVADLNEHITGLQNTIKRLEEENEVLTERIKTASQEDIAIYQEKIADNNAQIAILMKDLQESINALAGYTDIYNEMVKMDSLQVNLNYRINNIMADAQTKYQITWTNSGSWSSYTFKRKGTLPSGIGTVTLTASLSVEKPALYILGLKLRNGIVRIDWSLDGVIYNDFVADILSFDESVSDKDKAAQVNKKLSDLMKENPDCEVSVDYVKSAPIDEDNTEDTYHLLWASDRIDIARTIDMRLSQIYADLVVLNKMLSYRYTIADLKQHALNKLDWEQGKKRTVIENSLQRWGEAAGYKPGM